MTELVLRAAGFVLRFTLFFFGLALSAIFGRSSPACNSDAPSRMIAVPQTGHTPLV
jgi:hypothetical protein